MKKTYVDYLHDMLDYISRLEQTVQLGETTFYEDRHKQDAAIRQYEVIGEIAKRLPETLLALTPNFNWKQVKAFQDFLAHSYDKVQVNIIWDTLLQLPALRQAAEDLLANLTSNSDETGAE